MNFYKRHLGDYAKDAGHLLLLEHGAYTLLLDRYYTTEAPIPKADVYRVTRARTKPEKDATDAVLAEFFRLTEGAYFNKRAEEEIAEWKEGQIDVTDKRKHEAERKRRYRQRRSELFDLLRSVDIVPAFDVPMDELERLVSVKCPVGQSRDKDRDVRVQVTANQNPESRSKSKISTPASALDTPRAIPPPATEAGRACLLMRQAGCSQTNPSHPDLIAAIAEGVTPEILADTVREAVELGKPKPFAWAIATARGRNDEGAKPAQFPGDRHATRSPSSRPSLVERAQQSERDANAKLRTDDERSPIEGSARRVG